jgi:hypothetical protein
MYAFALSARGLATSLRLAFRDRTLEAKPWVSLTEQLQFCLPRLSLEGLRTIAITLAQEQQHSGWPKEARRYPKTLNYFELPLAVIRNCLEQFEARVSVEAGRALEHYRRLDDERIEDLLKYWLPIATGGPIRIEKVRAGEVFSEADFDCPLNVSVSPSPPIPRRTLFGGLRGW